MENVQTIISRYLELYSVHTELQNDTELSPKELIMNTQIPMCMEMEYSIASEQCVCVWNV